MGRLSFESTEKNTAEKKKRRKKVKIENGITNTVPEKTNSNSLHVNKPLTRQAVRKAKVCMKQPVVRKNKYQKKGRPYRYCCFFGCKKNNLDNVSFRRITCVPDYMVTESDRVERHMTI